MATSIYLGNPPENIKKWIEKNYKKPIDPQKTYFIMYNNKMYEYDLEGDISNNTLQNLGYGEWDDVAFLWQTSTGIKEIITGNKITSISLTVTSIEKIYVSNTVERISSEIGGFGIAENYPIMVFNKDKYATIEDVKNKFPNYETWGDYGYNESQIIIQ